jgi:hypothetical protein
MLSVRCLPPRPRQLDACLWPTRATVPRLARTVSKMPKNARVLALFDVDGTLTEPRKVVSPETVAFIAALREKIAIGVVGGSDLVKQKEQLGDSPAMFDWCFAENGLWAAKDGAIIGQTSFKDHLGEDKLKKLINWILRYFSDLDIPVKRGTFVEFRQGMLNVSPIGRNCSREERNEFEKFDLEHKVPQPTPRGPACTPSPLPSVHVPPRHTSLGARDDGRQAKGGVRRL